jgi:hypothetical protein
MQGHGAPVLIQPADPNTSQTTTPILVKVSTLTVPVQVEIGALAGIVNQLTPEQISGTHRIRAPVIPKWKWHGFHSRLEWEETEVAHVDYSVSRGAIELDANGDRVSFKMPIKGHARAIPGTVEGQVSGTVHGSSSLTVGSDFNLSPSIDAQVDLSHAVIDLLHLRFPNHDVNVNIPIRDLAQEKVNAALNGIRGHLAAELSKAIGLRAIVQKGWMGIPGTVRIPGAESAWITINPTTVLLAGPHAANGRVSAIISVRAQVETYIQQAEPVAPPRAPLPPLGGIPTDNRLHLALPVETDVAELNHLLCSTAHLPNVIKLGEGAELVVREASFVPKANQLYVKIAFEATSSSPTSLVQGTLLCEASPRLDSARQILSFDKISFTNETTTALFQSASWLLEPLVIRALQQHLIADLSVPLKKAAEEAMRAATTIKLPPELQMECDLDTPRAETILVVRDRVCVQFDVTGSLKLLYGLKQ